VLGFFSKIKIMKRFYFLIPRPRKKTCFSQKTTRHPVNRMTVRHAEIGLVGSWRASNRPKGLVSVVADDVFKI
jgi:hypothetical protein